MAEWRIKQFSELTKTSIRMLRYYDKFDLLKPSYRTASGYRCYTDQDLATLQQIIALRYFGFKLSIIKSILKQHHNVYAHLKMQQLVIQKQAMHFQQVTNVLANILKHLGPSDTPDLSNLIKLIEEYRMIDNHKAKIEKEWGNQLTEEELQELLYLYENTPEFPNEEAIYEEWLEKINNDLVTEPSGNDGEKFVTFVIEYGEKQEASRPSHEIIARWLKINSQLSNRIAEGEITSRHTVKTTKWIRRAFSAQQIKKWNNVTDRVINNLDKAPEGKFGKEIAQEWENIIKQSSGSSCMYALGERMWSECLRNEEDLSKLPDTATIQEFRNLRKGEEVKKLRDNTDAMLWLKRALKKYSN